MIFLANENFPLPSVFLLRKAGYDITSVAVDNPSVSDVMVMQLAIHENRTILTFDRDYGELVFKHGHRPPAGVVYFRLKHFQPEQPGEMLLELIEKKQLSFDGQFTVFDEAAIRQRNI